MKFYAGIDPGKQGAIGFVSTDASEYHVFDMPYLGSEPDTDAVADLFSQYDVIRCALEETTFQTGRDKDGDPVRFTSTITVMCCGIAWGRIYERLRVKGIAIERVKPSVWAPSNPRKLKGKDLKSERVRMACEKFPDADFKGPKGGMKDGRADAILLAEWARVKK